MREDFLQDTYERRQETQLVFGKTGNIRKNITSCTFYAYIQDLSLSINNHSRFNSSIKLCHAKDSKIVLSIVSAKLALFL